MVTRWKLVTWTGIASVLFLLAADCGRRSALPPWKWKPIKMAGSLVGKKRFGNYEVRIYQAQGPAIDGSFEITTNGRQVYGRRSFMFWIGDPPCEREATHRNSLPMGKDITGDGVGDLVIGEFDGSGMHWNSFAHVFQLGEDFRKLATLKGIHSEVRFRDVDHDGSYEAILDDWTFAYWEACFADSAAVEVILRFDDGRYVPAIDLMLRPAPAMRALRERAERVRRIWATRDRANGADMPTELWDTMLDLIYSGHADLAYRFLDMAWSRAEPCWTKTEFRLAFDKQLSKSPYWPTVKKLNGL